MFKKPSIVKLFTKLSQKLVLKLDKINLDFD